MSKKTTNRPNTPALATTQPAIAPMPAELHTYGANIMYIKPAPVASGDRYVLAMVRYADAIEIEGKPTALFISPAEFEALKPTVGDLLYFQGRNLVEGDTALDDGTKISRVRGFSRDFGFQVGARKREVVELVPTGRPTTPGIFNQMSELVSKVLGLK